MDFGKMRAGMAALYSDIKDKNPTYVDTLMNPQIIRQKSFGVKVKRPLL